MRVSLLGSNGFLSNSIGLFCNRMGYKLDIYGKEKPNYHSFTNYIELNLMQDQLDCNRLKESDLIIYAIGAGIQSNLNEESELIYSLNVTIPITICNSLKYLDYKGHFVTFGSYWEIGATSEERSFNEKDILGSDLRVFNDYTISKRLLTRFASSFNSKFTYWHFILPTIYGEMEQDHRLIPYTLKSIDYNSEIFFTSGDQIRQYIYINDVVNIIFDSINSNLDSGIFNIAGVEEFTVKELVVELFRLKGNVVPLDVFGKTNRADVGMKVLRLNGDKLKEKINYMPTIKISEVFKKYKFVNTKI